MDSKLNLSEQCVLSARKSNFSLIALGRTLPTGQEWNLSPSGETSRHLECWVQFWSPQYERDKDLIEYGP